MSVTTLGVKSLGVYPLKVAQTRTQRSNKRPNLNSSKDDPWSPLLVNVGSNKCRSSFTQLFQHFAPLIKSYARTSGLTNIYSGTTDELVQDVMVLIWRKAHLFNPDKASATTWIYALARNRRADLFRAHRGNEDELNPELIELEDPHEPTRWLHQKQSQQEVSNQLKQLPIEQREILGKVFIEEKTHQAVADELGLPLGTVKSRVRLGLQKLKLLLQPGFEA